MDLHELIKTKLDGSGIDFNETERAYITAKIEYNDIAASPSVSPGFIEAVGNTRDVLNTDREPLLHQFVDWFLFGTPCEKCNGLGYNTDWEECPTCQGIGRIHTDQYETWGNIKNEHG